MQTELGFTIGEPEVEFEFTTVIGKNSRSFQPIARFVGGLAAGWVFDVKQCFKDALDLQTVEIVRKQKKYSVESQGRAFNFTPGSMIHQTSENGKELLTIQVDESTPAGNVLSETFSMQEAGIVKSIGETKATDTKGRIIVRKVKYDPGYVKFTLYRPRLSPLNGNDIDRHIPQPAMERAITIESTQADLVTLLQTGKLITKQGVVDLLEKYGQKELIGDES